LEMGKIYSGYYAFKNTLCKNLINLGYENTSLKNRESAVLYKKAINDNDESLLYESIKLYPLMYYAWHQLGNIYRQRKDFDKAYDAYLTAAIIIETDHEFWIDCMGAAIAKGSDELATGIFGVIYQMFGRGVLNDIAEIFSRELKLSPKDLEETMKSFIELAEVYENSLLKETYMPPPIVYRHL
jgi:tetratricopeptide (TPR) repeat protein